MTKRQRNQIYLCLATIAFSNPVLACTQLDHDIAFCFEGTHWSDEDFDVVRLIPQTDFGSAWAQNPNDNLRLLLNWDGNPNSDDRLLTARYVAAEQPTYPGCETHAVTQTCSGTEYIHVPAAYLGMSDEIVFAFRVTHPGEPFLGDNYNGSTSLWSIHANAEIDVVVMTKNFFSNELTSAHLEAHRGAVEAIRLGLEERPL